MNTNHLANTVSEADFERLDLYLDGVLSPQEKADFERDAAANPALQTHLDLARAVQASMARRCAPPMALHLDRLDEAVKRAETTRGTPTDNSEAAAVQAPAPAPIPIARGVPSAIAASRRGPGWRRWVGYAVAAMIGIVGVVWWSNSVPDPEARRVLTAGEVMAATMEGGFKPTFVCKDDAEFVATVKNRFGKGLLLASTETISVLGWAYSDTYAADIVSKNTLVLMAKVEGREVLMFMDRAPGEHVLKAGNVPTGYRLFTKTHCGLVLYELTPFDSPRLIEAAKVQK
jgi:anti-sigma factor RsiW